MNATATHAAPCMSRLSAATALPAGGVYPSTGAAATVAGIDTLSGQLAPGQALSLVASSRQAMLLCIAAGHAWATLGEALHGPRQEVAGDVFLHPGQTLRVAAGQRVVLEPLDARTLHYRWSAAPAVQ